MDEFNEILVFLENLEKTKINDKNEESFLIEKIPHTQYEDTDHQFPIQINNDFSSGFDVSMFEQLMRDELIKEYYQSDKYVKTYISVTELISCLKKIYFQRKKYKID